MVYKINRFSCFSSATHNRLIANAGMSNFKTKRKFQNAAISDVLAKLKYWIEPGLIKTNGEANIKLQTCKHSN